MKINKENSIRVYQSTLLWGVLFLFFFQLLTEFVEGIYLYGLLGTEIPPEITLVVLFFTPFVLIFRRTNLSTQMLKVLASIGIIARCIEIVLPTRGRMIISGIGLVGLLLFIPAVLALHRTKEEQGTFSRKVGIGLSTAVVAHVLFRALHSGSDLSAYGNYRIVTWGLAAATVVILWFSWNGEGKSSQVGTHPNRLRVVVYSLGIFGVLVVLYFGIIAPNVIARWAGVSSISVFVVLLVSWGVAGWWWLTQKRVIKYYLVVLGMLLVTALVLAIVPHQVNFPQETGGGYPLSEPDISVFQRIPLYVMVALSPVLLLIFMHYLDGILAEQPRTSLLSFGFGLGSIFLLLMVLSQVFTTVYDYIPVVGPFFRDKYWLVFLVPGLVAVLPLLLASKANEVESEVPSSVRRTWLLIIGAMAMITVIGLFVLTANPFPPVDEPATLQIFTYNIQQGYDDLGERNFDGQIALIQQTSPDIIGLQESDTARIAGGNADVVAYFADRLDMYSYYGPSPITGTFGIALLSKYPIEDPHTYFLYSEGEQVAVIEAQITVSGMTFNIFVTHLGNGGPIIQMRQMLELMRGKENVIAFGDFNFRPYEEQYAITNAEYDDAYIQAIEKTAPTIWGENEAFDIEERIDHVFISPGMLVLRTEYFTEPESDHPGLFVEISLEG
jgi:endonuclease/exonuclease/phosphatase family metal-dependent hydrolase